MTEGGNTEGRSHGNSKESKSEREIQTEILLAFGALPFIRIWRMNTGKAYGYSLVRAAIGLFLRGNFQAGLEALKRMPLTTYGQPGASDIQGLLHYRSMNIGRFIAIEVKQPGKKATDEQERWQDMIEAHGGLYILAHSVEDVRDALRLQGFGF